MPDDKKAKEKRTKKSEPKPPATVKEWRGFRWENVEVKNARKASPDAK